jgi:hypothetical protein
MAEGIVPVLEAIEIQDPQRKGFR